MTRKNRRIYMVALLALLALTIAACGGSAQPQPTALPEPTPTAPAGLGDVWTKAQQSGKLVVACRPITRRSNSTTTSSNWTVSTSL